MPASKLPPLIFHQLPLPKLRKRSGILVRAGLAESYAQIFSNQISESGLILSTNALFFAPFIHGNGPDTPTASPNYHGRAENLSASFFTGPSPSRRLIRLTIRKRKNCLANIFAYIATSRFPI